MVHFKLLERQLPVVERALYVASRSMGKERSRGCRLERICAGFLPGRAEESTPEEILMLIQHLVKLLPPEYQTRLAGEEREEELARAARCYSNVDFPAASQMTL